MNDAEIPLTGGRITQGVVRVGETVRRPVGPHSPFVHDVLRHLEASGLDTTPRLLGVDEGGREVLSYLHGETMAKLNGRRWTPQQIGAVGRLLRGLHDATAGSPLAGESQVVCHGDFSPTNVVFVEGLPLKVFDLDGAHPGRRVDDLAYAAWLWLLGAEVGGRLQGQLELLRVMLAAYGADDGIRDALGAEMITRVEAERDSHERAGRGPALAWVRGELEWLRRHAATITAGVARA